MSSKKGYLVDLTRFLESDDELRQFFADNRNLNFSMEIDKKTQKYKATLTYKLQSFSSDEIEKACHSIINLFEGSEPDGFESITIKFKT